MRLADQRPLHRRGTGGRCAEQSSGTGGDDAFGIDDGVTKRPRARTHKGAAVGNVLMRPPSSRGGRQRAASAHPRGE